MGKDESLLLQLVNWCRPSGDVCAHVCEFYLCKSGGEGEEPVRKREKRVTFFGRTVRFVVPREVNESSTGGSGEHSIISNIAALSPVS